MRAVVAVAFEIDPDYTGTAQLHKIVERIRTGLPEGMPLLVGVDTTAKEVEYLLGHCSGCGMPNGRSHLPNCPKKEAADEPATG